MRMLRTFGGVALLSLLVCSGGRADVVINSSGLSYGISRRQNDGFQFDFTGAADWGAGSQRSANGNADPNNQRAGRLFAQFQLSQPFIDTAQAASQVSLTFTVDSIGQGVAGTPYNDGLDVRYLGLSGSVRSAATLWNTPGVGGSDQADILATTASPGTYMVTLTNPSVLSQIQSATAGQYLALGMSNSVGLLGNAGSFYPVGNSIPETYTFQMNHTAANYALTVVPEPGSIVMLLALVPAGLIYLWRRRRN